jgi:hypothetical protein
MDKEKIIERRNSMNRVESYPPGTVLFGGHPNWQRKFSAAHPEVRIMSGVDAGFPENVLSANVPLLLLNSHYMSHKVFFKIRALQKRLKLKIEYVR